MRTGFGNPRRLSGLRKVTFQNISAHVAALAREDVTAFVTAVVEGASFPVSLVLRNFVALDKPSREYCSSVVEERY